MKDFPWYALQVRPRYEKIAAESLLSKGYDGFLPIYRHLSRWSDRVKEIHLPLFPGYLFCRFDLNERLPILLTPGIIRIVRNGKNFYPVEEYEIAALQAIVLSSLKVEPWSFINVGQKVRIELGALAGVEGILIAIKGSSKLVVSVSLLQRSVAVEVEKDWVIPLADTYPLRPRAVGSRLSPQPLPI